MADKYNFPGVQTPPPPPKWGRDATLGEKLEMALARFLARVVDWGWKFFANLLVEVFDQSMKIMRPGTKRATDAIFSHVKTIPDLPAWFKTVMDAAEKEEGESSFLLRLAVFVIGIRMILFGGMRPLENFATYNADKQARSFLPDVNTTASFRRFGIMSDEGYRDTMAKLGVSDKLLEAYLDFARNLPNLGDVIAAKWRGTITDEQFRGYLKRMGYVDGDIPIYEELSKNIPPLTDLIHMMVREAWSDSTSAQFGYDDDYPVDLNDWLKKQGYDQDWGKRYWRAHWSLPSPTQAYEMLHRGLIDEGTLKALLKTADYPSFWRDKLMNMSYHVYTRVDIRRMVQAGMMDEKEALKAYQEMGYPKDKAEKLTEFALRGITQDEKDLTKAEIVGMYIDGISDRAAASTALVKMGYDGEEAESLLRMADLDIVKLARTDAINLVKEKYLIRKIDDAGATSELSKAGLKAASIDRYLIQWRRQLEATIKIPSIAEAGRFYLADIIEEAKYRELLTANNVSDESLDWYVREVRIKKGLTP